MADGALADLDALYVAKLADFTPLRTKLAAEAKKRGDAEIAKQIAAARKPTAAAYAVNVLVLNDPGVRRRLTDLGERLRTAHSGMDGGLIRELTTEQRRLIDELARSAFEVAAVTTPTAALRDDVAATLQAAIADPEVATRLGRLTKAEQWSGFGEFGDTASVFKPARAEARVRARARARPRPNRRRCRKDIATTTAPRNGAAGSRHARRWPLRSAPRPTPMTQSPSCSLISRPPGCEATMRAGASTTPKVRSLQPKTPMRRRSRPAVTPRRR